MKTKFLFIASFVILAFFTSCSPSDNSTNDPDPSTTVNSVAVDNKIDAAIEDVSNIVGQQFTTKLSSNILGRESSSSYHNFLPLCATATWTYSNGIFTGTIDFGTEGCALANGNILKGKISFSFSGNFLTPEQTITYSFDGFYHNGNLIQGSKTITRSVKSTDLLATAHPVFSNVIDLTITFADGSIFSRKGNRIKEMINDTTMGDDDDDDWENKIFLVTGSETTTFPNGDIFTNTIKTPLRYELSCRKSFPVSGTISKVKNGVETLVDYGTGQCDNLATVTTNGVTTTIKLDH